ELKKCPMCGSGDIKAQFCDFHHARNYSVRCAGCGLKIERENDIQIAIAAWNRRANSDLRPEVTELGNAK
ncbi:Lar family restriction alleviation protein, partial [Providencia huashanensis]